MRIWLDALLAWLFVFALVSPSGASPNAAVCLGCHGSLEEPFTVNGEKYSQSVHGSLDCVVCHMTLKGEQHAGLSGKADKATRELAARLSSKSKIDPIVQAACAQCHPEEFAAYKASVHAKNVMVDKSSDGPVCTSCHGSPHSIRPPSSSESPVNHFNIVKTCGTCHEEKIMSEKYHLSKQVMERYKDSFHGRKLAVGDKDAPSCADCHGAHDIKSVTDPSSPVMDDNKIKTCGKCHKGANKKFVAAITHRPLQPIARFTEIAMILLTISVVAFVGVHVLLDIIANIRDHLFRDGDDHE
jgi:hypothetical protein